MPQPSSGIVPRPTRMLRWRHALRRLWSPPDPELVDAGREGEWLIAGIRLLLLVLVLYFPLSRFVDAPGEGSRQIVLWVALAALAEALVVYTAVRRSWGRRWIGFFSGVLDISLVTLSLWIYLRLGRPFEATGDLVIFPVYLLAIASTSLRYDWRICVITGLAAIGQYLTMVSYAAWQWELWAESAFSWQTQCWRLVLLAMATLLSTTLVVRANEQRKLSIRDRLTNLSNRGFFDESLQRIGALAARSGQPVAVAMIDIDHFKRLNDTYGHLAGDEALRRVSDLLSKSVRTTDLVARYGGEEFACLFPGMQPFDAQRRLDDLRMAIAECPMQVDAKGGSTHLTVSIGVAVFPQDGASLEEALAVADLRLYQAKNEGRNRVVAPQAGTA